MNVCEWFHHKSIAYSLYLRLIWYECQKIILNPNVDPDAVKNRLE